MVCRREVETFSVLVKCIWQSHSQTFGDARTTLSGLESEKQNLVKCLPTTNYYITEIMDVYTVPN